MLFAKPNILESTFDDIAQGKLTIKHVVQLLGDVAKVVEIVGLGFTEHFPLDALAMQNMLARLPLIGKPTAD